MSTILKRKFDWVLKDKIIVVYSDHSRYFRDSILFTENDIPITPHRAIQLAKLDEYRIDDRMLSQTDMFFLENILVNNGVAWEKFIR